MSQKLTKNSRSQNLIKKLKAKIVVLETVKGDWYANWKQAQTELEKQIEIVKTFKELRSEAISSRTDALEQEISHLQEIIKWLIKPSTTEKKRQEDYPRFRGDKRI